MLMGQHSAEDMLKSVYSFITKFILCRRCNNPETELSRKEPKGPLTQRCKACSFSGRLAVNHKFASNTLLVNSTHAKAEKGGQAVAAYEEPSREVIVTDETEIEWSIDVSEEAVRERKKLSGGDALVMSTEEKLKMLEDLLNGGDVDVRVFADEVARLDCQSKAPMLLLDLWNAKDVWASVTKYMQLHHRLLCGNLEGQKYFLRAFMLFMLENMNKRGDELRGKGLRVLLLNLYQKDLLEEESLLAWDPKKRMPKTDKAKTLIREVKEDIRLFMDWLRTAEEESCSEEEVEDGIVFAEDVVEVESDIDIENI